MVDTAAPAPATQRGNDNAGRYWLVACVALTVLPIVLVPFAAPSGSQHAAAGLGWVLFLGSAVHVASSGWFYSVHEVREHMSGHRWRYLGLPTMLIASGVLVSFVLPPRGTDLTLLALFGWQFVHFQKQNLGMAALAASATRAPTPTRVERRALVAAAAGAVLGVAGHPQLLLISDLPRVTWLAPLGAGVFACGVIAGTVAVGMRPAVHRPVSYLIVYCAALLFFAPLWLFASPYAAVAGLTIAHGLQYLLLIGLVAGGGPAGRQRTISVIVLVDIAMLAGLALNAMSHQHGDDTVSRVLFGGFLGITAAHFVIDAGLWRLRDAFPREFLTPRLPYLLGDRRPDPPRSSRSARGTHDRP